MPYFGFTLTFRTVASPFLNLGFLHNFYLLTAIIIFPIIPVQIIVEMNNCNYVPIKQTYINVLVIIF